MHSQGVRMYVLVVTVLAQILICENNSTKTWVQACIAPSSLLSCKISTEIKNEEKPPCESELQGKLCQIVCFRFIVF